MPKIPLEELARLPSMAFVTPSHDGQKVAFYYDQSGRFELYCLDLQTKELTQATHGQAPKHLRAGMVWTRNDREIIFAKDHNGDEQHNLFKLDLDSGKVVQMNHDPRSQEYPGPVHPDNTQMAVMSNRAGQMNVFVLDLASENHEWRQITRFSAPASAGGWSPDGQWLAVNSNESSSLNNQDGYVVRRDGSEVKKVLSLSEQSREVLADWHPGGELLAFQSDASGVFRVGVLGLSNGQVRWLTPSDAPFEEYALEFSPDGAWLAVLRNHESAMIPVVYHLDSGEAHVAQLPLGATFVARFVLGGSRLLVQHSTATQRAELLLYDWRSGQSEVLLSAEYGSIDPQWFAADEHLWYPTFDGRKVPALLYVPQDLEPNTRVPALVLVHGGPTAQFFRGFDPFAQYLANQGYVILQPNVRGSTGYGVAWRDLNLQDWGGGDLEDVVAGAQYLRTLPFVDPERIGVFGGSYGGYMSFMAVSKKPEVFKVGAPWVGITDLHALYEESMEHFKYYLRQQMGDPQQNHALWRDRSAISHAHQLQAKLLILHGANDPRCPISQARLYRQRLLELGKTEGSAPHHDFEYHEFADEGHGASGDIAGKIRTYSLLADFLARRL